MTAPLWWLEHAWKSLSLLVLVLKMVIQLQRNYRKTLRLHEEQLKRQMSLEIYREFAAAWEQTASEQGEFGSALWSVQYYVDLKLSPAFIEVCPPLITDMTDVAQAISSPSESLVELSNVLEKYEVAAPELRSMRVGILDQWRVVMDHFAELSRGYHRFVPRKDVDQSVIRHLVVDALRFGSNGPEGVVRAVGGFASGPTRFPPRPAC